MRKVLLVLAFCGFAASLWAADPFVGTWKMNPTKSTFIGQPVNNYTVIIEAQGNGLKLIQDRVEADGKVTHIEFTAKYDGKDYPLTGNPDADTVSYTKPNANTTEYVYKKNGKEVYDGRAVVSKDGKTMTRTLKGKNAQGQDFTYSMFLEKQ
jgi:hypothetical protein